MRKPGWLAQELEEIALKQGQLRSELKNGRRSKESVQKTNASQSARMSQAANVQSNIDNSSSI